METLENRWLLAALSNAIGTTLQFELAANESLSVISNGTTYGLTSNQAFTDSGVADTGDFSAFGVTSLTLQSSGLTRYDTISIVDAGADARVIFNDSGANAYSDNISIVLDVPTTLSPVSFEPIEFNGATSFTASNSLSASSSVKIVGEVGANVTTDSGSITLLANQQAVATTGGAFYHGIHLKKDANVNSSTGAITLKGKAGDVSSNNYGIYIENDANVGGSTTGQVELVGFSQGGSFGYGVNVRFGGTVTSGGGDVIVTGTGHGGVGAGVFVSNRSGTTNNPASISAGGSGTVTITGHGSGTGGTRDIGVWLHGDGDPMVTSAAGDVTVTGNGGGTGPATDNFGIFVESGTLTAGGTGKVTVTGQAGNLTGSGFGQNYGVFVSGSAVGTRITSSGGNVFVTGTGGGGTTSNFNTGVSLSGAGVAEISAGGAGTVSVVGIGGNTTGSGNRGVHVENAESRITSSGGNVSVSGTGNGSGGFQHFGVFLRDNGKITAGGTGMVTVDAVGGNSNASGGFNHGFFVNGLGTEVASSGGDVTVTGAGGSQGIVNQGVRLENAAQITAGGTGSVTVTGTGGGTSGNENEGVKLSSFSSGAKGVITSSGGDVSITGTAGFGSTGIRTESGTPSGISTSTSGTITLTSDSMNLGAPIDAQTRTVTLQPRATDQSVGIGLGVADTGTTLGLSNFESTQVTAGSVVIGAATSGPISPLGVGVDATATSLVLGSDLSISVDGLTVDSQYDQLNVVGTVDLNNTDLVLSGSFDSSTGNVFTIVSASNLTGTFNGLADNSEIAFNGRNLRINYTATVVTLTDIGPVPPPLETSVDVVGGDLLVTDIGGGVANDLSFSVTGSDLIITDNNGNRIDLLDELDGGSGDRTASVTVPLTSFSGIAVDTLAGDDSLTFAAAFDPGNTTAVTIDGGGDSDTVNWQSSATLASLDVTAEAINLDSGSVTTTGDQTYGGGIVLGANTILTGVNMTFGASINSDLTARDLTVNASGNTSFNGVIGSDAVPQSIKVTSTGPTVDINAAINVGSGGLDIDPPGTINVNAPINSAGGPVSLVANNGVSLSGATADITTSGGALTVDADADEDGSGIYEQDDVGSAVATAGGSVSITSGDVTLTGTIDAAAGTVTFLPSVNGDDILLGTPAASSFAVQFTGSFIEQGVEVAVDSDNNVYSIGQFDGTSDFDPGAGVSNLTSNGKDVYLTKLDRDGNLLWAKALSGPGSVDLAEGIALDSSGNVYATGYFDQTVDFDPGPGTFNLTSSGISAFVLKLDSDGNFVWAKEVAPSDSRGFDLAVDGSGNVHVTGTFSGTTDFDPGAGTSNLTAVGGLDIYVLKLDTNGDFVWARSVGGTSTDQGFGIDVDGSGNVYTSGAYFGTVDFDPLGSGHNLVSNGLSEIFVWKLDSAGNFGWANSMGGPNHDLASAITADASGNTYTTGYFRDTATFGAENFTSALGNDVYVTKIDSSGSFVWTAQFAGGANSSTFQGRNITLGGGNVYTAGSFTSTVDFDPGLAAENLTAGGSGTFQDTFLTKLDSSGNLLAARQFTGANGIVGNGIAVAGGGNVYTTGVFFGSPSADFDPGTGTQLLTPVNNDAFVSSLDANLDFTTAPTALSLSDAELDNVTTSKIVLGDANAGDVTFLETFDLGNADTLEIITGGNITQVFNGSAVSGGTVIMNGDLTPGLAVAGTFAVDGDVVFDASASFEVDLNGATPGSGHDQLVINGDNRALTLAGATLDITIDPAFTPTSALTIIDRTGTGGTLGGVLQFPIGTDLNDGDTFTVGSTSMQIEYDGGDGNDVVLVFAKPTYDFSAATFDALEGDVTNTTEVVTITRAGLTTEATSVDVLLLAGATNPATVDNDYTAGPITLNFAANETVKSVPIEFLGDTTVELDETIALSLGSFTDYGEAGTTYPTSTLTITNDDSATVSIIGQSKDEGTIGPLNAYTFTVTLSDPVDAVVSMIADTQDGSATAADDFTAIGAANVSFPANSTTPQTVTVNVKADSKVESNEAFDLALTSLMASGLPVTLIGGAATETATASLMNDDLIPGSPGPILDDGDVGFDKLGTWFTAANPLVQDGDFLYSVAGSGENSATWSFDLDNGQYRVSVSYRAWTNRATNAPFTIIDRATELTTVLVDQQQTPSSRTDGGINFHDLGIFNIVDDRLVVTLTNDADGLVVADAIRVERLGDVVPGPEVHVTLDGAALDDGVSTVDFGTIEDDEIATKTFTVINLGTTDLTLTGSPSVPAGFLLASAFTTQVLAPFQSTTFEVQVDTSTQGNRSGQVSFANNDVDNIENPFNFTVSANVIPDTGIEIIDNGDSGYSTLGSWSNVNGNGKGHQNDFQYANSGSGNNTATWTFDVTPGQFEVSASWKELTNRSTTAPFTVFNDSFPIMTTSVNQQVAAAGIDDQGTSFTSLGLFNISSSTLVVTLSDNTPGLVVADAIRIERTGAIPNGPEIVVTDSGNGVADGSGVVDFGDVETGSTAIKTLTVYNFGTQDLTLGSISALTGFTASNFASTTVAPNGSTTFDLQIDTSVVTPLSDTLSFTNNDSDESPFEFTAQGNVTPVSTVEVIDDGDAGFSQAGAWTHLFTPNGHTSDFHFAYGSGTATSTATWTFDTSLSGPGQYRVSAHWRTHTNRATDATYSLNDDASSSAQVDQKVAPSVANGIVEAGSTFEDLGTFNFSGNTITVTLTNLANGLVIADAMRIERVGDL